MKKLLLFALMTSLFANSQTAPLPLTAENLAFYKSSFPTIKGNRPTDNNNIYASQLGVSIDANEPIYVETSTTLIPGSSFSSYDFQVTDIISGQVGYVKTSLNYFRLSDVKNANNLIIPNFAKVNRSYNIKVKGNGNSVYPARYGSNCLVMTRPLIISNTSPIKVPQGNQTINSTMVVTIGNYNFDQIGLLNALPLGSKPFIRIRKVTDTVSYEMELKNNSFCFRNGNYLTVSYPNLPNNYFVLGATYCVDVRVVYDDGTFGDYSDNMTVCYTYGTAGIAKTSNNEDINISFDAIISPNPSNDNFNLDIKTVSKSPIEVSVIDINGRIIDTQKYTSDELSNLQIGNNYSPGVYNLTIIQDENKKSLKLIKN